MAGPWERFANEKEASAAGPWSNFAGEVGDQPAAPALKEIKPFFGEGDPDSFRQDQVLGRGVLKGAASGFLGLPALAADAAINVGYGAKKLASKTGLVEAPNPENYYGKDGGWLPVSGAVSQTADKALDAAGFARPQSQGERLVSAGFEGAAGGVGGFLAGKVAQAGGGLAAGMASTPAPVQAAAGAAAGVAGQGTAEGMDSELGRTLPDWTPAAVGMATGMATGGFLGRAAQRAQNATHGAAPTRDELRAERDAAYGRARTSGVEVQGPAFARLTDAVRQDLDAAGIYRDIDPGPGATRLLQLFDNSSPSGAPVPMQRVEAVRQAVSRAGRSTDPTEVRVAQIIRERMDDFVERQAQPADFISPTPGAAERAIGDLRQGRRLHGRVKKDTALENALISAEDRAGSTGTGANQQNAQRQDIRKMIRPGSPEARRVGFNAEETAQARSIVRGDPGENLLRGVGKFAPSGPVSAIPSLAGIGAGSAIGGSTGALVGAALPVAGYLAKGAAERIQRGKVDRLSDTIRRGYALPQTSATPGAAAGAVGGFLANDDRQPLRVKVRPKRYR